MNAKKRCWDLTRVCAAQGLPLRFALSPERDYYIKHHRNLAGSAWVWLQGPGDLEAVRRLIERPGRGRRSHYPGGGRRQVPPSP